MDGIREIFGNFGWREAVVLCILLVTIYFVVMVLRYLQLPRQDVYRTPDLRAPEMRTPPPEFDAPPGSVLAGVWASPPEPRLDAQEDDLPELYDAALLRPRPIPPTPAYASAPADADIGLSFSTQLTQKTLEGEVRQLHDQLSEARDEIQRLRQEMSKLSAAQKVSPLYSEAMAMAIRGVDAAGVAGRCGISIAEAELVVALSRRPEADEPDREEGSYGRNA